MHTYSIVDDFTYYSEDVSSVCLKKEHALTTKTNFVYM